MAGSSDDASANTGELARQHVARAHAPRNARPIREEAAPARSWFDTPPTATLPRRPGARKRPTCQNQRVRAVKISARERTLKQNIVSLAAGALLTPRATILLLRAAKGLWARCQSRMSLQGYACASKTRSDNSRVSPRRVTTKRGVLRRIVGVEKSTIELCERPVLARRSLRRWCRSR